MHPIPEIDFVPYSTELVLPPLYALRPYLPFTPDSSIFALLSLITWSLFLTWLTAKVCFKEVTPAKHEEVVREEPRDLSGDIASSTAPLTATNTAVDEAMARVVMVAAEREASAKAAVVAAMARAAEATERERAKAAPAAAEATAVVGGARWMQQMTVAEREAAMAAAAAAAEVLRRLDVVSDLLCRMLDAAAAEAADAESKLEAARNARVAAEGRARAERELARG